MSEDASEKMLRAFEQVQNYSRGDIGKNDTPHAKLIEM